MGRLLRRLQFLLRRDRMDAELAEEIEFHRAQLERDLHHDRAAAGRAMGNSTLAREEARAVWILPWIESFWQDLAYGIRGMRRQPGFTLVALAALSIGIGLNTSLFTVFNAVAYRQWPVKDPARVVNLLRLIRKGPEQGGTAGFGFAEWRYLMEHSKTLHGVLLTGNGEGVEVDGRHLNVRWVSGNYFSVLGIDMARGRGFLPEEDSPQDPRAVAVLSYQAWQNRFGGDPYMVGKTLRLDDVPTTIVGIAPEDFTGTSHAPTAFWAPFSAHLLLRPHDTTFKNNLTNPAWCCFSLSARLAPGSTRAQAAAEVDVLTRQFDGDRWSEGAPEVIATGTALLDAPSRDRTRAMPIAGGMFLATTLVLLLACANVGNLLLARAAARHTEIAVRLSLGGSRLRLIRQLLVESLALAIAASAIGLAIAWTGPQAILTGTDTDFLAFRLTPDLRVFGYDIALAVLACLAFGLAPALHGTRGNIAGALKSEVRPGGTRLALRSVLLATQVAVSVILLAGAGLLVRGLQYAQRRDPGYRMANVTVATLELPASAYSGDRTATFSAQLQDALAHAEGLGPCAVTSDAPMANSRSWTSLRQASEGRDRDQMVQVHDVTAGYFDVLGIPVVAGRNFTRDDVKRDVLLVNETAARKIWHSVDPVGKLAFSNNRTYEVVGVVKDAYTTSLARVEPTMYWSAPGRFDVPQLLVGDTSAASRDRITAVVRGIEPRARIAFTPLSENFRQQLDPAKYGAAVAGALGILALALASIGMSGVFAYVVRQRTREIGVRMALGAQPSQVVRLVLGSNLRALVWGLAAGLAGAFGISRLLAGMLNGASPYDPLAYAAVFALLVAAAAAASILPARRAARVNPVTALRWE